MPREAHWPAATPSSPARGHHHVYTYRRPEYRQGLRLLTVRPLESCIITWKQGPLSLVLL